MTARKLLLAVLATVVLAVAAVGAAWATGDHRSNARTQSDVISVARFSIQVDGNEIASFAGLGAITSGADSTEYVQSSTTALPLGKLPGRHKPPSVTLTRGVTPSLQLWTWHQAVLQGQTGARKSVSLVMYDSTGKPVAKYLLVNAWPSRDLITGKKAGATVVLSETVTFVCESIQRVSV
jgi:phage tail-like protein